jgi:hypothetical protein
MQACLRIVEFGPMFMGMKRGTKTTPYLDKSVTKIILFSRAIVPVSANH